MDESRAAGSARRVASLDGIRGWASLIVLLFHMLRETWRGLLPEMNSEVVRLALDGYLAVAVFFILSGEALSVGFLGSGDVGALRVLALRRYFRLTLPILLASFLVLALMEAHLSFLHEAAAVLNRPDWLGRFLRFEPDLVDWLGYALWGVYFRGPTDAGYIPFLWTMPIELLGSFVVFATLLLVRGLGTRQRLRLYAAVLMAVLAFDPSLAGFIAGVLFAEARLGGLDGYVRGRLAWRLTAIGAAVLLALAAYALRAQHQGGGLALYGNALAVMVVIFSSAGLERFFGNGLSRFLGRVSFPIYLLQFPVLMVVTSGLVVRLIDPAHPSRVVAYGISLVSIAATLLLGWGFTFVERPMQQATRAIVRAFLA